ncbi:hypothetical protein [Nocardia sp. NPDC050406]|uniref:hypothetical protein n=1 Tax=Nocardia sp. NPDC050406 TaxID=3364318 RepID=UPI003792BDCF
MLSCCLTTLGCAAREHDNHSSATTTTTAPETDAALVIDVRIAGGSVTPTDARLDAQVNTPIDVVVDSDTHDELHVHGTPEHTFAVVPGTGQRFRFTIDVPGRVELELHEAGRTVATLLVR